MRTRRVLATFTAVMMLATACGANGDDDVSGSDDGAVGEPVAGGDDDSDGGELDPAETSTLTVGVSLPNVGSQAPLFIAEDQGFFADEGLDVEVLVTDEVREGLVGGSLDFAMVESTDVALSAAAGIPIVGIAGWRVRQPFLIAARDEIGSPEDLAGRDILLGGAPGTEDYEVRSSVLAEEGFDISDVDVNAVSVPGGSNAWVELFLEDQLAMTVLFARHRPLIEEAGHNIVADVYKEWPNDTLTTNTRWLEDNPNTAVRFLRALLRSMELWKDLDQQEYVQELMAAHDFTINETELLPEIYAADPDMYDRDMCPDPEEFEDVFHATGDEEAPAFDLHHDVSYLHRAQELVGVEACP